MEKSSLMIYAYATAMTAFAVVAHHIIRYGPKLRPVHVSPDGVQYLAMSEGKLLPPPYSYRWLLPWVVAKVKRKTAASIVWCLCSWIPLAALGPLLVFYLPRGWDPHTYLFAVLLLIGLPGVFRVNVIIPVLVDAAAAAFMLAIAAMLQVNGKPAFYGALALCVVGASVRETVPIFAALAAWSPWPLVGLAAVLVRHVQTRKRKGEVDLKGKFSDQGVKFVTGMLGKLPGLKGHGHNWLVAKEMVLPWGVALAATLRPDVQLAIAALVAYSQLMHGLDRARLYQWCFPTVIARAAPIIPHSWYVPAVLLHVFHPWNDKCV